MSKYTEMAERLELEAFSIINRTKVVQEAAALLREAAELEAQITEIPTLCRRYEARISELEAKLSDPGTTHAEGCWSWGPRHYECAERRIAELEAALPSLDWVKTSDRLPDYPDWDEDGYLWGGEPGRTVLIHYADTRLYPYWMPKPRATPPRPPEGE